jgi:hypothetical protein
MTKHRPPPRKPEGCEQQFEKLLAAMEANDPFSRYGLKPALEQIKARWAAAPDRKPGPKLVRQYRNAITKVLALSNKIGPDFLANDIEKAGWSRHNPDADDRRLQDMMDMHGHERTDVDAVLTEHGLNIDHWFRTGGEEYRKRDVTKLVVEPFLQLMVGRETKTSRKDLFEALFDWIGIEARDRPSNANINAIARDKDAPDSSSEPR